MMEGLTVLVLVDKFHDYNEKTDIGVRFPFEVKAYNTANAGPKPG